jgi:hypothetical protein
MIRSKSKRHYFRNKHGNMLAIVVLVTLLVVAILGIGIAVSMMMMSQKRTQSQVENLSLEMASAINKDDWVGQMNNMTEFSRELVFTSRSALNEAIAHHQRMRPLAIQLMDEARQSATLVESERKELTVLIMKDLQKRANNLANTATNRPGMNLPGVSTDSMQIKSVDAGYIEGVLTNLTSAEGLPDLREYDLQEKYVTQKSFVYLPNINAKLPAPDDDIKFDFCSLPAAAKNTIAPARLTANAVFRKLMTAGPEAGNDFTKCKFLPSAIQMISSTKVNSGNQLSAPMSVSITAASPGAALKLP